jgi:hypothetical protein
MATSKHVITCKTALHRARTNNKRSDGLALEHRRGLGKNLREERQPAMRRISEASGKAYLIRADLLVPVLGSVIVCHALLFNFSLVGMLDLITCFPGFLPVENVPNSQTQMLSYWKSSHK